MKNKFYKIILLLAITLIYSCSLGLGIYDKDTSISYNFENVREVWHYTSTIKYIHDIGNNGVVEYWQIPSETVESNTGDCEDIAILMMHLLKRLGYDTTLIISYENGLYHALVGSDNIYLDAQKYNIKGFKSDLVIVKEYSYADAMYLAFNH